MTSQSPGFGDILGLATLECIGTGGRSAGVFKHKFTCPQQLVELVVAVKKSEDELASLQEEGDLLQSLHHPNIVQCLHSQPQFIVMEYCAGSDLAQLLKQQPERRLPLHFTRRLLRQLASAMSYLHQRDPPIFHGDIKPSNALLTSTDLWSCVLKLADFGFARPISSGVPSLGLLGPTYGTPLYMAPEMVSNEMVDLPADVWSYGVVAFEMAVGEPPIRAGNLEAVKSRISKLQLYPIRLPTPAVPNLPSSYLGLLSDLLRPSPEDRLTAPAVLRHLFFAPTDPEAAVCVAATGLAAAVAPLLARTPTVLVEPLDPLGEGDRLLHSVEAVVGIAVLAALRGEPLVQRWAAQRLTDLCDRVLGGAAGVLDDHAVTLLRSANDHLIDLAVLATTGTGAFGPVPGCQPEALVFDLLCRNCPHPCHLSCCCAPGTAGCGLPCPLDVLAVAHALQQRGWLPTPPLLTPLLFSAPGVPRPPPARPWRLWRALLPRGVWRLEAAPVDHVQVSVSERWWRWQSGGPALPWLLASVEGVASGLAAMPAGPVSTARGTATHFVYASPCHYRCLRGWDPPPLPDSRLLFAALGGFLYLDCSGRQAHQPVVAADVLCWAGRLPGGGRRLGFAAPVPLPQEAVGALRRVGRLQPVRHGPARRAGAQAIAWLLPGERISSAHIGRPEQPEAYSGASNRYGAFAILFVTGSLQCFQVVRHPS
eukprot:EG_transcript_3592